MPVGRRAIGRGLEAAVQAMTPMLGQWQDIQRQNRQFDQQGRMDLLNRKQALQDKVAAGTLTPEQAAAEMPGIDFSSSQPSVDDRLASVSKDIAGADSLSKLPTEPRVRRRLQELDIPTAPTLGDTTAYEGQAQPGQLTFSTDQGPVQNPNVSGILGELDASRKNLQAQVPATGIDTVDDQGLKRRTFVANNQLAGVNLPAEATPEQASGIKRRGLAADTSNHVPEMTGQAAGTQKVAELDTAGPAEATQAGAVADAQNASQLKYAGATAGAQERARLQAQMASMGMTQQQQQAALQLGDDFSQASKEFYTQQEAFRKMATLGNSNSPAADLGLIFGYMKMLDPNSSVREGEQATAANAVGIPDKIRNYYNRVMTGDRLAPEQRQDFLTQAKGLYESATKEHQMRIHDYSGRAQQFGVPASLVIREPATDITMSTVSPADAVRNGSKN